MGKYFQSTEAAKRHFEEFFSKLVSDADSRKAIVASHLSFSFILAGSGDEFGLRAENGELVLAQEAMNQGNDVRVTLKADLLHQLLLGKLRLMPAIMARQITARGQMDKQKELGALLYSLRDAYQAFLKETNKTDLLG